MNAIVLAFRRLPLDALSCFGGTQVSPSFDRLAARAAVFDRHYCDRIPPERWTLAEHSWWPSAVRGDRLGWSALSDSLDVSVLSEGDEPTANLCVDTFADLVSEALRRLRDWRGESSRSELLWLLANGVSIEEPSVHSIDADVGRLLGGLQSFPPAARPLLVVTSAVGVPRRIEGSDRPMWAEQLADPVAHTPLIVQPPESTLTRRISAFVQTCDLVPSLIDWLGRPVALDLAGQSWRELVEGAMESASGRHSVQWSDSEGRIALRTDDWCLMRADGQSSSPNGTELLFVKPDDVWDVNNVARLYPEEVETLFDELQRATG